LESLDFFNEKTSKLRRELIFEAPNENWIDSNKEITFFHPTPSKEWKKILNNTRTENGSLRTIITGPASVGKTTFLIELTLQAIRKRKRILVSGYNHSTINHFLQVLYDEIDQKSDFYPEPFTKTSIRFN
jgi:predicted AAA+ superfamily ATPase